MDNKFLYKMKPKGFAETTESRRLIQASKLVERRHQSRTRSFFLRRNIISTPSEDSKENRNKNQGERANNDRLLALQRFKSNRDAIKKAVKAKQKPPFVVGIPHHGTSPILKDFTNNNITNKIGNKTKQIFEEPHNEFNFQPHSVHSVKKLTSPHTPTVLKRSAQKNPSLFKKVTHNKIQKISKPSTISTNPVEELAKALPVMQDENLNKTNEPETSKDPSQTMQLTETLLNTNLEEPPSKGVLEQCNLFNTSETSSVITDCSSMITVMNQNGKIVDPKQSRSSEKQVINDTTTEVGKESAFQRARLDEETSRLLAYVEKWEMVVLQEDVPQDVADDIDSVVGLTKLLTRDKFSQFRGLIGNFEKNDGIKPVTQDDLNGFWDMVYLQVESLVRRYTDLERLKSNNWVQQQVMLKKKQAPTLKSKNLKTATSSIKELIQAKRRKQSTPSVVLQSETTPLTANKQFPKPFNPLRPRSNSPSPFIAMRLSAAGRSLGRPGHLVEASHTDVTPNGMLKDSIKMEVQSPDLHTMELQETDIHSKLPSRKAVKFEETSVEEKTENHGDIRTPRYSLRLQWRLATPGKVPTCNLCSSPDCSNKDCIMKTKTKKTKSARPRSSPNHKPQTDVLTPIASGNVLDFTASGEIKTPRRSLRLQGRPPTTPARCSICFSPDCNNDCVSKKNRRITRYGTHSSSLKEPKTMILNSTAGGVEPNSATDSIQTEDKDIVEPKKKFILRPSNLYVVENTNLEAIPKKIRMKRSVKVRGLEGSPIQ